MEENRYKRLTQLFINRVDTIEMMKVFEGKEKQGLKIYRSDSEKYYRYMFMKPSKRFEEVSAFKSLRVMASRPNRQIINYELCLNKNHNEAVLIYYITCTHYMNSKEYITRAAMRIFKDHKFTKYTYDNELKQGIIYPVLKVKAVLDENIPISEEFETMDQLEILSNNHDKAICNNNFNVFFESLFNDDQNANE